jgi:hypothetical protein
MRIRSEELRTPHVRWSGSSNVRPRVRLVSPLLVCARLWTQHSAASSAPGAAVWRMVSRLAVLDVYNLVSYLADECLP